MKIGIVVISAFYEKDKIMMRCFKKEFKILLIDRTDEHLTNLLYFLCESSLFKEHKISEPIKKYVVTIRSIYNEKLKRVSDKIESVTEES